MGLTGSTPLTQYAQQNARDISSQDMESWLQNVLGINREYGQGLNNLVSGGQGAANNISNLLAQLGISMGQGAYGAGEGRNQDRGNIIGGLIKLLT
jgi:CO dehydrogenase/acetyl-CoA synthase gamma subunit (corrinoid Fe-S protein)